MDFRGLLIRFNNTLVPMTLAALGLFAPSSAQATFAEKCGPLFSSEYALQGRLEILPSALGGPKPSEYVHTLEKVHAILGPLQAPTETRITIDRAFIFSSFNAENFSLSVGLRPDKMGSKHPSINQHTLIHEYGHAVFEKNLMRDLESYRHLRREYLELQERQKILEDKANELGSISDRETDPKTKKDLEMRVQETMSELFWVNDRTKELGRYWKVRSAAHELFADVITLATTKDPKAIEQVLRDRTEKYAPHSSRELLLRDFTSGRHHKSHQTWKKESPFYVGFAGDLYYAFLPARWELWRLTKTRIESDAYRRTLAPKVFEILVRHLSEAFAKSPAELGAKGFKDIEALNERIIEDLRKEL